MAYTLYKANSTWDLPSYSAASIQLEAYLRLSRADLSAEGCSNPGSSPSGQLPALEDHEGNVLPSRVASDFEAARSLVEELKTRNVDLDGDLSGPQRAQALAFTALVQSRLEPATIYTNWCETESFTRYTRVAVSADLPFPLNRIIPWTQRRALKQQFASSSGDQVYQGAAECYKALAEQLQQSGGDYLVGNRPSSADAFLFGHLVLHLRGPTTAPELRHAAEAHEILRRYADKIIRQFDSRLPPPPQPSPNAEWAAREAAAASGSRPKRRGKLSREEIEHRRRNWLWLGCAVGVVAAYVVFSGQVLEFGFVYDDVADEELEG